MTTRNDAWDYKNRPPIDLIDRIRERSLEAHMAAAERGVIAPPPSWLDVDLLLAGITSRDIAISEGNRRIAELEAVIQRYEDEAIE